LASRRIRSRSIANPPVPPPTEEATAEFRTHDFQLAPELAGLRIDQALARALPQYSRGRIQGWIEAGAVQVEGRVPRGRDKVLGGERVRIQAQLEGEQGVEAESLPLDIVYEDRSLLVINKPPGLVVHPGAGNARHTLQNALLAFDSKLSLVPRAGIVHRLDKDTSGLLVVARTPEAHTALVAALAAREVGREYLAICTGVMTSGGTINEPIGRHRTLRTRMTTRPDGREAVTHFRILQRFNAHTYVRVQLETGRTHQIRVHLSYIGFPIVGDPVYGGRRRVPAGCGPELEEKINAFGRQALHATRLKLEHPDTGLEVHWEVPPPADFKHLLKTLAADE